MILFFLLYASIIQCNLNMLVICVLFRSFVDFLCFENHVCFESWLQNALLSMIMYTKSWFFSLVISNYGASSNYYFWSFLLRIFSSDNIWLLLLMLIFVSLNFHHHLPHTILHINFQSPTQTWCLCKSYKKISTKHN